MAERYEKVFTQAENLYTSGAPLILEKGALLKDGLLQNIIAQLRFKNIQNKVIKAVTIKIVSYDILGQPLNEQTQYQYLDLFVKRDESFGEQIPIIIKNPLTRSYKIIVSQVVFINNNIWTSDEVWYPLAKALTCEQELQEPELCKQYAIEFGSTKGYMHSIQRDLFICACGAINRLNEEKCHQCGMQKIKLINFNKNDLQKNCQIRLENEKAERLRREAEWERKKQENCKRVKNFLKISIPLLIVLSIGMFVVNKYQELDSDYRYAMSDLENKEYEEAIEGFQALGNFKDSPEQLKQAQDGLAKEKADIYKKAKALLEAGNASGASSEFNKIKGYKDVDELSVDAFEQENINYVYDGESISLEGYDLLENNEAKEILKGTWMLVGPDSIEKINFKEDGKAVIDDGTVYQFEFDDNKFLFFKYDEENTINKKYKYNYSMATTHEEVYYIGLIEDDYKKELYVDMILLPVDSEYVRQLQSYVANEKK